MKTKLMAVAIGIMGLLVAWWGIATLRYYRSFTETAEGVVARNDGKEVVLRFHEERSAPAPQETHFSSDAEYVFPQNDRTGHLKVGDRVAAYHPPGRLQEARLDKKFSYCVPGGSAVVGGVLVVTSAAVFLMAGQRKTAQAVS